MATPESMLAALLAVVEPGIAVIGGTSLMGGYGRIGGTIIGSIIMGILINGLVLMNVSAYYQQIITGLIIVLAVAFDTYAKSRRGAL